MATTTFSGPVKSQRQFVSKGHFYWKQLAETTNIADHQEKLLLMQMVHSYKCNTSKVES